MSDFDPSKHPRVPAGSSAGGQFGGSAGASRLTRAADRSAAAQGNRMVSAYEQAKKHAQKLKEGKTEVEIATEAGFPPGHEQHWAFRNGLAHAARDAGSSSVAPAAKNFDGHTARQIKTSVAREAAQRGGLARVTSSSAWGFTTHYKDGSKNQWAFNRGDLTPGSGLAPLGKMLSDIGAKHGASVVSKTVPLPKLTRAPKKG
jgi:hypothetical protein